MQAKVSKGTTHNRANYRAAVGAGSAALALALGAPLAFAAPPINPLPKAAPNPVPQAPQATPIPSGPPGYSGPSAIPDPPANYGWRANPFGYSGPGVPQYIAPTTYKNDPLRALPLPPPPPMILPEPGTVRVGNLKGDKPTWMTVAEMNSVNRWAAYIEANIARFWISQGVSPREADRRAASMAAGGVGGAVLFGVPAALVGAALGAVPGAAIGAVLGAGAGWLAAFLGLTGLIAGFCIAVPIGCVPALPVIAQIAAVGAIAGAVAGIPIGAAIGGVVGGAIGAVALGVPGALLGLALGNILGGGDPNQNLNPLWVRKNGRGEIVPRKTLNEFHWDGNKQFRGAPPELDITFSTKQGKRGDIWLVKLGPERWVGASREQREQHFYPRFGALAPAVRGAIEDRNGVVQQTIRGLLGNQGRTNPYAHWNGKGALPPGIVPPSIPYGATPTPIPWEKPNRSGLAEWQRRNNAGPRQPAPALPAPRRTKATAPAPVWQPPVLPQVPVWQPPQVQVPAVAPVAPRVTRRPAPAPDPVAQAKAGIRNLVPGLAGLRELQ